MNHSLKKLLQWIQMDQYQVLRILARKKEVEIILGRLRKDSINIISTTIIRSQFQFSLVTFSGLTS